jgi:hypothetical protein
MKKNVSTALFFIVPGLLLTSWYAYARTKEKDTLSDVPLPSSGKVPDVNKLMDHY